MLEKDKVEHNLSYNRKNCILLQIGEKRVLTKIISNCEKIIELLKPDITVKMCRKTIDKFKDFN